MDDRKLLKLHSQGDSSAFSLLVDRHQAALLRYATVLTSGDANRAQDAVQEAFLSLVHLTGPFPASPQAWLFRVTRNRVKDQIRKEARMRSREKTAALPEEAPAIPSELEAEELGDTVTRSLAALPEEVREVVVLKVHEGLSYRRIAKITDKSPATICALMHQGLSQLARGLQAAGVV